MTSSNDDLDDELLGLGIGRARKQKSGRTGRDETRPAEQQARWLTPETVLQNVSAEPGGDGPTDPGPERWSEEPAAADLESGQALPSSRVGGFFPGTGSLGRSSEWGRQCVVGTWSPPLQAGCRWTRRYGAVEGSTRHFHLGGC